LRESLALTLANGFALLRETESATPWVWRNNLSHPLTANLDEQERQAVVLKSGLRHARYNNFASALGVLAAKLALSGCDEKAEDIGVISVGGPLNFHIAWKFIEQVVVRGVNLTNPLSFPHTLVSSVPTTVAASIGANAFAFAVGHDHLAFFDVLKRAKQAIEHGFAKRVLGLAVFDPDPLLEGAMRKCGRFNRYASASICARLECARSTGHHLELLQVDSRIQRIYESSLPPVDGIPEFRLRISRDGKMESNIETSLASADAFVASGGVFCAESARRVWHSKQPARHDPFAVLLQTESEISRAVFRWS
jgi:hypothetical protein